MSILYVVATPIGNLEDMSERGLRTLREADLILAEDTRHTLKLLNHFEIKTKMSAYHKFNEKQKSEFIIEKMKNEELNIALVTDAGTPCISDPGYEIVKYAHENGITVTGIPGSSAVINSLAISGFDTANFSFFGFIPREKKEISEFIRQITIQNTNVVVIYESPKRIVKSMKVLKEYLPTCNVCVMSDMTKFYEKIYRGTIDEVIDELEANENVEKGEYAIVIEKVIEEKEEDEEKPSLESMLIDVMVKEDITLKDAIYKISKIDGISKKDVYDASLKLKELFN